MWNLCHVSNTNSIRNIPSEILKSPIGSENSNSDGLGTLKFYPYLGDSSVFATQLPLVFQLKGMDSRSKTGPFFGTLKKVPHVCPIRTHAASSTPIKGTICTFLEITCTQNWGVNHLTLARVLKGPGVSKGRGCSWGALRIPFGKIGEP